MREVSLTPWQTRLLALAAAGSDFKITGGVGCGRGLAYSVAAEQYFRPGSRTDGASGVLVVVPTGARYEELTATLGRLGTSLVTAVTREIARMEYLAEESMAISYGAWSPRYGMVVVESDGTAPPHRVLSSVPTGAVTAVVEPEQETSSFGWTGVPTRDWTAALVTDRVCAAIRPHTISRDLCWEWGDRADVLSRTTGRVGDPFSGGPWRVAVVAPPSCGLAVPDVVSGVRGALASGAGEEIPVLNGIDPGLSREDLEAGRAVTVAPTPDLLIPPYTMLVCLGPDAASCQVTAERASHALVPGGVLHVVAPEDR